MEPQFNLLCQKHKEKVVYFIFDKEELQTLCQKCLNKIDTNFSLWEIPLTRVVDLNQALGSSAYLLSRCGESSSMLRTIRRYQIDNNEKQLKMNELLQILDQIIKELEMLKQQIQKNFNDEAEEFGHFEKELQQIIEFHEFKQIFKLDNLDFIKTKLKSYLSFVSERKQMDQILALQKLFNYQKQEKTYFTQNIVEQFQYFLTLQNNYLLNNCRRDSKISMISTLIVPQIISRMEEELAFKLNLNFSIAKLLEKGDDINNTNFTTAITQDSIGTLVFCQSREDVREQTFGFLVYKVGVNLKNKCLAFAIRDQEIQYKEIKLTIITELPNAVRIVQENFDLQNERDTRSFNFEIVGLY